jgi:tripartite-type tricarboxylate transporter receptor subunit TctC
MQLAAISFTAFAALALQPLAAAQDYPARAIRILTSEAGGGSDFSARIIAQGLNASLGQPVVVDNRVNIISMEVAMHAPPDGYTLLLTGGNFYTTPLMEKVSYDPVRDFSPIAITTEAYQILVVHPSLPVHSVRDLIVLAKAHPGELNYSSPGTGSSIHLASELFKSMAKVDMVHVAYKGTAPSINGLLSGQVQLIFSSAGPVAPLIKAGKLRAIAVTSAKPSALYPNLPTVAATVPGYESQSMTTMWAPVGTSATIIQKLNREVVRILDRPDVKQKYANVGLETVGGTPEELAAKMKHEIAVWGKLIKQLGLGTS